MPPLAKIIWTALTGSLLIIIAMVTSWGQGVESQLQNQTQINQTLLQSKAAHDQELKDIHEDLLRIEDILNRWTK